MGDQAPLDFVPLWAVLPLTLGLVVLSIELGFFTGRRRSALAEPENQGSVGAMASASLALLAFMLAFTFGFAASRLEARRTLLLDEVNALGTTFLRAGTLPEPEGRQARGWLREYVDGRLEMARSGDIAAGVRRAEALQEQLWESAAAHARANPGSIVAGLYLQTLNETIDLHTTRINEAVRVRIPLVIWVVLYALTIIGMAEMGYQTGLSGKRRPLSVPAFALGFAVVMYLIADLDRFQEGLVRVSQQPMIELRESMTEAPR